MSKESESFEACLEMNLVFLDAGEMSKPVSPRGSHRAREKKNKRREKKFSAFRVYVHATVDVTPRESKSFEALLRGGEKLFSPYATGSRGRGDGPR